MVRRRTVMRRRAPIRRLVRTVNRQSHGTKITPSPDPPSFSPGPWWPMTVAMLASSDTITVTKDLHTAILAQLDWTGFVKKVNNVDTPLPMEIRLVSVRTWGTGKLPHQLTIYDALGGQHRTAELTDYGSNMNYSRNGWKFGTINNNDALKIDDKHILFEITGASSANKVLAYVQVLIRTENTPKPVLALLQNSKRLVGLTLSDMEI